MQNCSFAICGKIVSQKSWAQSELRSKCLTQQFWQFTAPQCHEASYINYDVKSHGKDRNNDQVDVKCSWKLENFCSESRCGEIRAHDGLMKPRGQIPMNYLKKKTFWDLWDLTTSRDINLINFVQTCTTSSFLPRGTQRVKADNDDDDYDVKRISIAWIFVREVKLTNLFFYFLHSTDSVSWIFLSSRNCGRWMNPSKSFERWCRTTRISRDSRLHPQTLILTHLRPMTRMMFTACC